MLVLSLETSQYWTREKDRLGRRKAVELGTEYSQPVPWLTSLDTPAHVLQITGALVGRDGRAIRIGAEGLFARRTSFLISSLGAQTFLTEEDVDRARTLRRDELPGRPLVWQAAILNLVAQLTGRGRWRRGKAASCEAEPSGTLLARRSQLAGRSEKETSFLEART